MTILRIVKRRVNWETYRAVGANVNIDHEHPLGLIMHGALERDGVVEVAQIWDSEPYAQQWDEDVLKPALQAAGAPLDAEVTVFEMRHLVTP